MKASKQSSSNEGASDVCDYLIQTIDLDNLVEEAAYHIVKGNISMADIEAAIKRRKSPKKRRK